jgi:hypothetical protein
MTPTQRAAVRAIITRMNASLAEIDLCDEEMIGGSAELHTASNEMRTALAAMTAAHKAMSTGHEYIVRVAAHNKRVGTVLREANAAALALLDDADGDEGSR